MKQLLFLSWMCILCICTHAQQKPQYSCTPKLDDSAHFGITYFATNGLLLSQANTKDSNLLNKTLTIYEPRNFNYPPKGRITALYLWVKGSMSPNNDGKYSFYNLNIRFGTTSRDSFGIVSGMTTKLFDEETELKSVIFGSPYTIPDTTMIPYYSFRRWLKMPLTMPFMFDPNKNLVVQFETSNDTTIQPQNLGTSIIALAIIDSQTINKTRTVSSLQHLNYTILSTKPYPLLFCIGLDIDTTGVSEVDEVTSTKLTFYPNPAITTIHFSLKGSYTISTLQGAVVQQGEGDAANIGTLQQGLYMVQLTTNNGKRLVGRFLKE